jgi:hypothetical protein
VQTLIVVDAANVVGSVPDGWWRDRAGATARLRDRLAAAGDELLAEAPAAEVVLVVEGRARGVSSVPGVRVVPADGSGDDAMVEFLAGQPAGRERWLVTADRGLRDRALALGVRVVGPRSLRVPPR